MSTSLSTRTILRVSVLINVLFVLVFVAKRIYFSIPHDKSSDSADISDIYDAGRNSVFQIIPIQKGDVVFAGNSLVEGFPVTEMFHSLNIKNRGIGRNTTAHLMKRLPAILAARPQKVFLEIGINDVIKRVPIDTIISHYNLILDLFAASSTVPYVQSLPNVSGAYCEYADSVQIVNAKIKALCETRDVTYVDLYSMAADSTYYYDGLHLNGRGYIVWKKAIDQMMTEPVDMLRLNRKQLGKEKTSPDPALLAVRQSASER